MRDKPQAAQQLNQQLTSDYRVPKISTKARIISVSTLYVTVELLEPTNLQPGQAVSISHE